MTTGGAAGGIHILMLSIHGLVRSDDIELGRDPDTGGQVTYVVELAKALARQPNVGRVDLLTRQVFDARIDESYAVQYEQLGPNAHIVRVPCGPRRYLRKERLWPYLDSFVDHTLKHVRMLGRNPDVIHGHYADAGYVGSQLARLLGVPFVFTGHSLGRVKRERLIEKGGDPDQLERRYQLSTRIEAEERALDTAALVVASTQQEVEQQYAQYENYQPERMEVIPPGVDLNVFSPPDSEEGEPPIADELRRFLNDPEKPMILAMARPDERKNFSGLIRAYGEDDALRERANLVLVAGNRDRLADMDPGARRVMNRILTLIDEYDLYGSVAYPKHHRREEVPGLYRLAARTGGVFVNPALTEPFGLTLIEAAASGLPIVATNDGGPRDIVARCENGLLVDAMDEKTIARAIRTVLEDRDAWRQRAERGVRGAREHYAWASHATQYLTQLEKIRRGTRPGRDLFVGRHSRLPSINRILVTDVDNTLTGDVEAAQAFARRLAEAHEGVGFAVATGRRPESALQEIDHLGLLHPDILITCVGTEIYYGRHLTPDRSWQRHIAYQWQPDAVRAALDELDGLHLQDPDQQRAFKISYDVDLEEAPPVPAIHRHLRSRGLRVKLVFSHQCYLDVLPIRASTGLAIRYLCFKWDLPPDRVLAVGDSGNDEEMLQGNTLGVVVGNYSPELEGLRGRPRIYFAKGRHAWGILEGVDHYDFFGAIRVPENEEEA